ncbi:MAG: hypothetical protein ABFS35_22645 [Bacteroidota bacterium]
MRKIFIVLLISGFIVSCSTTTENQEDPANTEEVSTTEVTEENIQEETIIESAVDSVATEIKTKSEEINEKADNLLNDL